MNDLEFLKKQHLSMFEKKTDLHKTLVANLYKEYIADKDVDTEDKSCLYSNFYLYFSKHFPAEIYEKECIVGTNWHWGWQAYVKESTVPHNGGHFIADYQDFLEKGIRKKTEEVCAIYKNSGFKTALESFSEYIKAYAKSAEKAAATAQDEDRERLLTIANDCAFIAENPPVSFRQALQLVWFIQCFLETESGSAAISFGRADVYLYPYYKRDIEKALLSSEKAKELIMAFYIKVSEGDESIMLTVGGDIENELTALFIEAQTKIRMRQPSIALRVSETTSSEIWEKATALVLNGSGMPAYFNDTVIIEGLKMLGIDEKTARNYGIVGCYEAAPQGIFSNTVATCFNLYDSFDGFLELHSAYSSFDAFLNAYKKHFENYYVNTLLPGFKKAASRDQSLICPFASCVLNREKYILGINILGIGVLIDSLYTIKKLVFDENYTTIENLKKQAEKDFEDISLYEKITELKNHYGSDSPESNRLAKDITEFIGDVIHRYSVGDAVLSSPALFRFTIDIRDRDFHGTINGRKKGELLSYGIMPCETPHKDFLTSILMSCANISAKYFPDGCPVMISLNQKDIQMEGVLPSLIKAFFESGGFHLAVNTIDAKLLEKAKQSPKEYADILVKISGYSAKFTTLNEKIQEAVIERANCE